MLTGQVGVVHHGTGFMARAIEWVTRSNAHHVVVAVSETECMSAEPGGARVRSIGEYVHITWSQYDLTPDVVEAVVNGAWSYLGVRYNRAAFLALGWHYATGLKIPDSIARWLNRRPYVTCSQMATQVMAAAGAKVPDTTVVCPGDWQRLFQRLGWMEQTPTHADHQQHAWAPTLSGGLVEGNIHVSVGQETEERVVPLRGRRYLPEWGAREPA